MSKSILQAVNLSKTFSDGDRHIEVLKNINFEVMPGELVAIIGPSGSGKSTLLHLLGGLDLPSDGWVNVAGRDIDKLSPSVLGAWRNKNLGFVYQFHHLLPEFSALENVCMPLLMRKMDIKQIKHRAESLLDRVGLSNRLTHRVGELSGGERQRVAIARALVTKPQCVLADEPTGNLDHDTAEQVSDLILELNRELHTAFVIVTHNLTMARSMQRILTLTEGTLV